MSARVMVNGDPWLPVRPTKACMLYAFELGHMAFETEAWETAADRWALVASLAAECGVPQPDTLALFATKATQALNDGSDGRKAATACLVAATNALEQLGYWRVDD